MDLLQSLLQPPRQSQRNLSEDLSSVQDAGFVNQDNMQHGCISVDALKSLGVQNLVEWEASRALDMPSPLSKSLETGVSILSSPFSTVSDDDATVIATPLGGPHSTENIQRLYRLCQTRGLTPEFQYHADGQRWRVEMNIAGQKLVAHENYASKMEGKEACARMGLPVLATIPLRGETAGDSEKMQDKNWIGLLIEYCNATSEHQPSYQEYAISNQGFAMTVTLPSIPSSPLFGSPSVPYNSKRAAKAAVSSEAVAWLRTSGLLGAQSGPIRKKTLKSETTLSDDGNSGSITSSNLAHQSNNFNDGSHKQKVSAAQEVVELCKVLGLNPPTYRLEQQQLTSLYSGAAYFDHAFEDSLNGPVGEVRNVFGRKNAKEESAKGVVKTLNVILESRSAGMT